MDSKVETCLTSKNSPNPKPRPPRTNLGKLSESSRNEAVSNEFVRMPTMLYNNCRPSHKHCCKAQHASKCRGQRWQTRHMTLMKLRAVRVPCNSQFHSSDVRYYCDIAVHGNSADTSLSISWCCPRHFASFPLGVPAKPVKTSPNSKQKKRHTN